MLFSMAVSAMAGSMPAPDNPATGIWIQTKGRITPHEGTAATLYYTLYENGANNERVKSINYEYDGEGYLLMKPTDRKVVCYSSNVGSKGGVHGADGIVHHPGGDLLVAAQGTNIHRVKKNGEPDKCVIKTAIPSTGKTYPNDFRGFWHLMMEPDQNWLWASDIPGYLFRYAVSKDSNASSFADYGYMVDIEADNPNTGFRKSTNKLTTLIWDGDGRAFFTYSGCDGGGCEGTWCTEADRKRNRAKAYFGVVSDSTVETVTTANVNRIGGKVGQKVVTKIKTKILIDSLEGAHGGTYDSYSQTIFVFGGSRIVQIQPVIGGNGKVTSARKVSEIDLREFFFNDDGFNGTPKTSGVNGWRLDQGTTDGYGHLFVASNTGHMVFVDYSTNKRLDNNVLVHVQWMDYYLDDLAPLSGVGVIRKNGTTENEYSSSSAVSSSSLVVYTESSSSRSSSSGNGGNSSNSTVGSSSSGNGGGNSSGNPGNNSSSSGNGGNEYSSGSNNGNSSSGNGGGTSSGNPGDNSSSSGNGGNGGDNPGNSSGSNGGSGNNSSGSNGNGEDIGNKSSSSRVNGSGDDVEGKSSSSRVYYGAEDYEIDPGTGFDAYPTVESYEKGDSLVSKTVVVKPSNPGSSEPGVVIVDGNKYMLVNDPKGTPLDLHYNSGLDAAKVGEIVAITLDKNKVKEYFGSPDSLTLISYSGTQLVDPSTGKKLDTLTVKADGSVTIFVTADQVVNGGSIKVFGNNEMVVIDNINFYDPVPDSRKGYIKDTKGEGDKKLDFVEIELSDTLSANYFLDGVKLVVGNKTYECVNPVLKGNRIVIDVENLDLPLAGKFPKDAKAVVTYGDYTNEDATYVRECPLVEIGSNVLEKAYAIRNNNGLDSLFLLYNINLTPSDIDMPDMLVMIKQQAARYGIDNVQNVYMPTKNIVVIVGKSFKLKGDLKDSVSLYPEVTFSNLAYITSDEYEREIAVTVVDRFPSAKSVEYWDTDGDGTLDQVVTVFDRKLTKDDINESLYMTFPWYSNRGMMIQLQAQPDNMRIDPKDSTRVIWDVFSTTRLAERVTSIKEDLPQANIYTYYSVFGETFVNEESAPLVDKMSPVVLSATLSYGKKADTLHVKFSEPILYKDLNGNDYFAYIHGDGGELIELNPSRIDWSPDGLVATLVFNGSQGMIMPGDSIVVRKGMKDAIKDNYGNIAGQKPQAVIIGGLLKHLAESTKMGAFDANDDRIVDEDSNKTYTLQTVSSVNLRYLPGSTTKEDMEEEGALGQLVELGQRFIPMLVDQAKVAKDGTVDPSVLDSLNPDEIFISFIVNYYDHLGQYVNDTVITVPCNSPKFAGNCLATDKKVFVNWNFKDHNGRFVGTGVYNVQFKMIVRHPKGKIEEEIKDKWGVRRKKKK